MRRSAGLLSQNMDPGVWNRLQGATADSHEALNRLDAAEPQIATLETKATSLDGRVAALEAKWTPEGWHQVGAAGEPAFQNSWTNSLGSGHSPARFRKKSDGDVQIQMAVDGGATGSTVFTLPAGYRPAYRVQAIGRNTGDYCWATVNADGTVLMNVGAGSAPSHVTMSFPAEQ